MVNGITWSGGCGAVQKSDWSVLKDRNVTIWPDNDKPGINAAQKITAILNTQGNQAVKTVDLSVDLHPNLPHKWDLADKVPEGINIEEILANAIAQRIPQTITKTLETTHTVGKIQEVSSDQEQATRTIGIEAIRGNCKNHYMGYRITHENTEFIVKVTNDTYKELQQWTRLSGFTKDDTKLEVQAALTAVYTYLSKAQMDKDKYNVHANTSERAMHIGAIAGRIRIENLRSLTADEDVVQSAAKQYDNQEKEISDLLDGKPPTPGLTNVAKTEILRATFRCLSMTGFHISKEMSAKALEETKISCGMESDSQKAKIAIGAICTQLAKEAPLTIDKPLTIQQQREKSVVDYINVQINSKNHPWIAESIIDIVKTQLGRDPMLALDTWKTLTRDNNCFTPMSFAEIQVKIQEATTLLERQKTNLTAEAYDKLKNTMNINPQAVIQDCRGVIELQLDKARQNDINKYTELAKAFLKLPYNDCENSRAAKELNEIVNRYQKDEKFSKAIERNPEIELTQRQLTEHKINEVHRDFER